MNRYNHGRRTSLLFLFFFVAAVAFRGVRVDAAGPSFPAETATRTRRGRRAITTTTINRPGWTARNTATAAVVDAGVGVVPRGGASCVDATPALLTKLGLNGIAESLALWGILLAGPALTKALEGKNVAVPTVWGESLVDLVCSMLVVFGASLVGAVVGGGLNAATNQSLMPATVPGDPGWYAKLSKPGWTPPGWVFPIMWLIVSKPTQLCALSRIFKTVYPEDRASARTALAVYAVHLALGDVSDNPTAGIL